MRRYICLSAVLLLILIPFMVPTFAVEVLQNGDFSDITVDTNGWIVRTSVTHWDGLGTNVGISTYSPSNPGLRVYIKDMSQDVHANPTSGYVPGDTLYFTGHILWTNEDYTVSLSCNMIQSNGNVLQRYEQTIQIDDLGEWTTIQATYIVPENTSRLTLGIHVDGFDESIWPPDFTDYYHVHNFSLQQNSLDNEYPDVTLLSDLPYDTTVAAGDYYNLAWTATDNDRIASGRIEIFPILDPTPIVLFTWHGESPDRASIQWPEGDYVYMGLSVSATDRAGNEGNDVFNSPFNIEIIPAPNPPALTLITQPEAGTILPAGGDYRWTWNVDHPDGDIQSMRIETRYGNNDPFTVLDAVEDDAEDYLWKIPNIAIDSIQFRFTVYDENDLSDTETTGFFSTSLPETIPQLTWEDTQYDTREAEPNMNINYAQPISNGETIHGTIEHEQDNDVYCFELTDNQVVSFTISCWPSAQFRVDFSTDGTFDDLPDEPFTMLPYSSIITPGYELYEYPHPLLDRSIDISYPRYASRMIQSDNVVTVYARIRRVQLDPEAPGLPFGAHEYRVSVRQDGAASQPSADGLYDIMIWEPDPTTGSGEALASAFGSWGFTSYITADPDVIRNRSTHVQLVCICLGTSPNNAHLSDFDFRDDLGLTARPLYVEGGDVFGHDRNPSAFLTDFFSLINEPIDDIGVERPSYIFQSVPDDDITGLSEPLGMYTGENHRIDGFNTLRSQMVPLLKINDTTVMANNPFFHFTASTIEFSGLSDQNQPGRQTSIQAEVAAMILESCGLLGGATDGNGSSTMSQVGHETLTSWPNPFNSISTIRVNLQQKQRVQLQVFNILGQRVSLLYSGVLLAEPRTFPLNGASLSSGVYIVRMDTEKSGTKIHRAILIR